MSTTTQEQRPQTTPSGTQQRPQNGVQQRPQQRPQNGVQQRPQQRPQNGMQQPQQRPQSGTQQRPPQRPQQRPQNGTQQRSLQRPQQRPQYDTQQPNRQPGMQQRSQQRPKNGTPQPRPGVQPRPQQHPQNAAHPDRKPVPQQRPQAGAADEAQATAKQVRVARRQRTRHNMYLTYLTAGIIVLFFVVNLLTGTKDFSDAENRPLQQNPKLSVTTLADGSWFTDKLDYFSDQMFARDGWISLNLTADRIMGRKEENGVLLGRNGYLIAYPDAADQEVVETVTTSINNFSAAHPDYNSYALIIPTASQILTEQLPNNAPVGNQLAELQDFYSSISSTVTCIDAAPALSEHASEYIFYKTDHHWTSLGAYYTFRSAAETLGITDPSDNYDIYTVTTDFQGTLASKSGSHSSDDTITVYNPADSDVEYCVYNPNTGSKSCSIYSSAALETRSKYNVFFGDNYPLLEIKTTANNDRILLVFKDSYANSFMQFLIPYYEKIIMIDPRYYTDDLGAYLNTAGVTDVLYLYTADTILTDVSTADVLDSAT